MKFIKYIPLSIIIILISATTLLIGTPVLESNMYVIYIATGVFSIGYFIYMIIHKQKIEISPIDIGIYGIAISSLIPLIGKTYISLDGTINLIVQYFCIISLYIITKNECRKDPKYIGIIVNTIIISIIVLCIIGLDEINANYFSELKKVVQYQKIQIDERRVSSLFSYPNVMAAVCVLGSFLSLGSMLKSKKVKMKILYGIACVVMLITMVLTYSRLTYLLLAITVIIGLFIGIGKQKNKRKIYLRIAILIGGVTVLTSIYVLVGLQLPDKLLVKEEYQKIMYNVKEKEQLNFMFDIQAVSRENMEDSFEITITEKNKYFDTINSTKVQFGSYIGIKELNLKTQESTTVVYLNIRNLEAESGNESTKFIIKEATLNNKPFILKYKILPTKVIEKIQSINLKNKSAWERLILLQDGVAAIKENWLLGQGGNAWEKIQNKVQSYRYFAKEMHSFPIKVFLENGIIGFISCIGLIFSLIKVLCEKLKEKELNLYLLAMIVAVVFLLLHSLLDFDMSFYYTFCITTILIALISCSQKQRSNSKVSWIICILCIIMQLFGIYVTIGKMHYKKNTDRLKVNSEWTEKRIIGNYYRILPFHNGAKMKYAEILKRENKYSLEEKEVLEDILKNEKYEIGNITLDKIVTYVEIVVQYNHKTLKDLEFALDYSKSTEQFAKYEPVLYLKRLQNFKQIISILEEKQLKQYAEEFQKQFIKEKEERKEFLLDYEKSRYSIEEVQKYLEKIEEGKIY